MAMEVDSPPSPCLDSDPEDLPLAERRRRLLRPPAPPVDSKPPALDRSEASAAAPAEGAGGAAQQGWPGLPRGVEFNPSDGDLLWHLAAEVGNGQARRHPFISEFIKSVDETIGFGCTHPQDIPGIRQDGYAAHFFHKNFKVCNNGNDNYISWQKVGNPISIILDGDLQGFKEVFILYTYATDGNSPQITDWRLHQYHIASTVKDEGELVVSKIFFKSEKNQFKWSEKAHAQSAQDASTTNDDSREELQLGNHSSNMVTESSFAQGNENKQKVMQIETCLDQNKLNSFNVLDNMHIGSKINDRDEIEELDHMSLQERYRILQAEKHSCSAAVSSEQCAIDGLENSCRPETNGLIPKRNHVGTAFRDGMHSMLQEISSALPIIDNISDDNNRRLLAECLSNNQQSHEAGCDPGFLSMPSPAAPSQHEIGCSHDLSVNDNTLIYSGEPSSSLTPTFGDESIPSKGTNDRTFLVDIKLEPALEGDLAEKITSSVHSTDPKLFTEGSSLVGSINSDSSEISKRISEAARSKLDSSHVEGLLPSLGIKSEVTRTELPPIICGLTSINITGLTGKKTSTLNHDGGLAYCSSQRKRRKAVRDPSEKTLEEDSYINDEGTAYFSRRRRRRKTATDSIEKALEEDAPGLLQILLDRGILANEIQLYGVEEDDDMVPDCTESDFQDLENVIAKLFPQRTSLLKSAIRHEKGERAIYCLTCLISLVEQSRYLQFRDCPVEWGWCRDLQSFIFVFKSHNRIVLERPEYGYATYFFEIVKSLPIEWQIQRLVTAMKLSGCGRTALIENRPLLIGEDLTEGEARVLEEYGWLPNSGLGTMLNYRDRVVHDRWNDKSGTDWRTKIGKLLVNGYSEGHLILSHFPTKVGKLEEDIEVKQEDPF